MDKIEIHEEAYTTYEPLDELCSRHHPENPKDHDVGSLIESIQEFGFVRNVMVNETDGLLLYGHGTTEALWRMYEDGGYEIPKRIKKRKDGMWLVPTDRGVEISEERAMAYVIADNRHAELGGWNEPRLVDNLIKIASVDGGLKGTGFDGDELDALIRMHRPELIEIPEDPGAQIDKAEELQEKWQVERGQIWEIGRHRLMCGDSTNKDDVEQIMDGERADLTVTSPPYWVGKEYEKETDFDEHLELIRGFADTTIDIMKIGGFIFINFGEIAAQSHTSKIVGFKRQCVYPISKDYWMIFHVERGLDLYAVRIWYKPFNRLQKPFWSYKTSIPHHQEWEHIWTWRVPGADDDEVYDRDISVRSVWDTRNESVEDKPLTRHVAAFPVGIPERAIKAHSSKGMIIWEPFAGSGTTIVVCEQLERKCRAIEISEKYCSVVLERMSGMELEPKLITS